MIKPWTEYVSVIKTRPATAEEKAKLRAMFQDAIDRLREKDRDTRANEIEERIETYTVSENVTVERQVSAEQVKQAEIDRANYVATLKADEKQRSERVAIMREAAKNMKLTYEKFLKAFPSDVSVEELNAE